jgi:hypothetical protein
MQPSVSQFHPHCEMNCVVVSGVAPNDVLSVLTSVVRTVELIRFGVAEIVAS